MLLYTKVKNNVANTNIFNTCAFSVPEKRSQKSIRKFAKQFGVFLISTPLQEDVKRAINKVGHGHCKRHEKPASTQVLQIGQSASRKINTYFH